MKQLKIKIYHLESKSNDKNEAPVYLRIILEAKYIQLSTGIFLKKEYWDRKKKEVKSKHPDAVRLNLQIAKTKERLFDTHYELQRTGNWKGNSNYSELNSLEQAFCIFYIDNYS
jgi:Arm DNA-binding domain